MASSRAAVAVREPADRRQRLGTGEEELDALLCRGCLRQEAQGVCEPVRGTCGRQPDGLRARLAKHGRGADVAFARRALDVMGAGRRCSTPRRERLGATFVSHEPPAAGGGLVDRPTDERMSKAEAPGHAGRAQEIELQELVDRLHHRRFGHPGRGRHQLGLEGITCHCCSLQNEACRLGEQRKLAGECSDDGRRNPDRRQ